MLYHRFVPFVLGRVNTGVFFFVDRFDLRTLLVVLLSLFVLHGVYSLEGGHCSGLFFLKNVTIQSFNQINILSMINHTEACTAGLAHSALNILKILPTILTPPCFIGSIV